MEETFIQHKIKELIDNLNKKKEEVIKKALLQLNPNFDWEWEKQARFKSLQLEVEDRALEKHEHYYYNDGSLKGVRLVTFIVLPGNTDMWSINENNDTLNLKLELNYY